jgi:hypothetical protein
MHFLTRTRYFWPMVAFILFSVYKIAFKREKIYLEKKLNGSLKGYINKVLTSLSKLDKHSRFLRKSCTRLAPILQIKLNAITYFTCIC